MSRAQSPLSNITAPKLFVPLALLVTVLLAYLPAILTTGFIWDDPQYITQNYVLRTLRGLASIWIHPESIPQYYPLVHTTFWIEYHLVGNRAWLFHLDNALLHAASAVLLYLALRRLGIPGAVFAALLFALHPVQMESVAWASERKNVLSTALYLASLHAYLNFRGNDFRSCGRKAGYFLSLILFAAALLSKSVACSLPAAILLVIWLLHGNLRWRDLWPLLPMFAMGLAMALVTAHLESHHVGAVGASWQISLPARIVIASRALWFYAEKLIWPYPLAFIYPRWTHIDPLHQPLLWIYPASILAVIAALWGLRRRIGRGPLAAVLFFAGTLIPALGFVNLYPMKYTFVADHYQYLACVGLFTLAGAGLNRLFKNRSIYFVIPILTTYVVLIWLRTPTYTDELQLWRDVTQKNPRCWAAWGNLGDEYFFRQATNPQFTPEQRTQAMLAAQDCYQHLLELAPDEPMSHVKWGLILQFQNNFSAARAQYLQALSIRPDFTFARDQLGQLLIMEGQPREALRVLREAARLDPRDPGSHRLAADALEKLEDYAGAQAEFQQSLQLDPLSANTAFQLANLLHFKLHDHAQAIAWYAKAVALEPNRADIRVNFALALIDQGMLDLARQQYMIALKLRPDLSQARHLADQLGIER